MKKYPVLDVFRFLCACLVVVIHLGTNEETPVASLIVTCFSRQAVPFFFIVSGFFFTKRLDSVEDQQKFVMSYAKRMLIFYIVWVLLLLPQSIVTYVKLYEGRSAIYIALVLMRRIILAGVGQFWYLLALAETALIAGMLLSHNKKRLLYCIAAVGFCMGIIYSAEIPLSFFRAYNKTLYSLFSWNCNFLMMGLPYFTLGIFFAGKNTAKRIGPAQLICVYLAISAITILCYWAARRTGIDPERVLFPLCGAVLLFQIGIQLENAPISHRLSAGCREISSAIYCLHNLVIEYFLGDIMPWSAYYVINYIAVVLGCMALYWVIKAARIKPIYRLITLK